MISEPAVLAAEPRQESAWPLADAALTAYGLSGSRLILLEEKKNITFRVEAAGQMADGTGGRFLLRLCRPGVYSRDEIASEANWLCALRRDGGLPVPQPVAAIDGSWVVRAAAAGEVRHCILFGWIPGRTLEGSWRPELQIKVGELLGRMHAFGARFQPPAGFVRPRFDSRRIFGDEVLPAGWSGPLISRRERDLLAEATRIVRDEIERLGEGPETFGLIHTDPEPDNMVHCDGEVSPIDFADCGWGYFLYDIAAALLPLGEKREFPALRQSLLDGYLGVRTLPAGHLDLIDTFLIARGLFAIRWMLLEGWQTPKVRHYAQAVVPHILAEVRRYLDARSSGGVGRLSTVRFLSQMRSWGVQLALVGDQLRIRAPKGTLTPELQAELTIRKPEIASFLRGRGSAAAAPLVGAELGAGEDHPLSFSQRQLWFLDQFDPGNPAYNIPQAVDVAGELDADTLECSIGEVVRRQGSLRTSFAAVAGEPVQRVMLRLALMVPRVDLQALPEAQRRAEVDRLTREEALRLFELDRGPLVRFHLLHLGEAEHRVLVTTHHIVSDGWSAGVLIRELATIYGALLRGEPPPLPELPVQYVDYARWQRGWLSGAVLDEQLAYWRERLRGAPARLDLPADRKRNAAPTRRGGRVDRALAAPLVGRLRHLAREQGTTLFVVVLAGFQALLHRLSGDSDICVGVPVAQRTRAETEGLIGFFVNTLVLRTALSGSQTFRDLLTLVQGTTAEAYAHQSLPFARLVEELRPERGIDHTPLFQVIFNFQSAPAPELQLDRLTLRWVPSLLAVERFDFSLGLREAAGGLAIAYSYRRDLFDATTIMRWAEQYERLLAAASACLDGAIRDIPLLVLAERQQLLLEWTGGETAYPRERTIHELFAAAAEGAAAAVALVAGEQQVSYRELDRRADALAHRLRALGVRPEVLVGLCLQRSAEMVVATLAILKAGGAYVPLDPGYPTERLALLLRTSGARLVITEPQLMARLPAGGVTLVFLDQETEDALHSAGAPADGAQPDNLAYVMFTSGSTGTPKGVMVRHRSVVRLVRGGGFANIGPEQVLLQLAPYAFDAATFEIWGALLNGGRLVVPPSGLLSPSDLAEVIAEQGVTTLWLTAGLFHQMVELRLNGLRPLRQLLAGGDVLSVAHVRRVCEELPDTRLIDGYGPTESTTFACCHQVSSVDGSIPLGRPIGNTRVYVLDPWLDPVPHGVSGELCIGGDGLARGYLARPELTAERFVPDPVSGEPGARLYRTGDRTRWRSTGEVEYLGRLDLQVKVRGYRVEPGEIEAALRRHPGVREAAVLAPSDRAGDRYLVAFWVPAGGPTPSPAELRRFLREALPEPMVPQRYVTLVEVPLTAHGKIDRAALSESVEPAVDRGWGFVLPRSPSEEILAAIWTEVLEVEEVGSADDFFALGGHSLRATQVISRVQEAFGQTLPVRRLFEVPTLAGFAAEIEAASKERTSPDDPPLIPTPRGDRLVLSFAQQRLWFLDELRPANPAYNLSLAARLSGDLDRKHLRRALAALVERHETLRTTFVAEDGEPEQRIAAMLAIELALVDLRTLTPREREPQLRRLAQEEAARCFDLSRGPLVRLTLLITGLEEHAMLLSMHHIISDGWSMGVFLAEMGALYTAFAHGQPSPLSPLPIQYADFAHWQRCRFAGERLESAVAYWRRQLAGAPATLALPIDRPRPAVQAWCGRACHLCLDGDLARALTELSRGQSATLFMSLLAAFAILLARLTSARDVTVGSPIAGRGRRPLEGLIGFFVNTLVLRVDLDGMLDFRELLARVRKIVLEAFAHQDIPFERLVEELAPSRDLSQSPLFQVALAFQNAPQPPLDIAPLSLVPLATETRAAKFDLSLALAPAYEGIAGVLEYRPDLFDETTVVRWAMGFERLLEALVREPGRPISDLPLLSLAERQQILVEWNDTSAEEEFLPIHRQIESWAVATPHAVAVRSPQGVLTFAEVNLRANRLAHRLRALGVRPEVTVAVCLERSLLQITALLAVLKTGGAYLPLDPAHPTERLVFELRDSRAAALVTTSCLAASLTPRGESRVLVDCEKTALAGQSEANPDSGTAAENLAYVVYTSGSTGVPKGVAIEHRALVNLVAWHRRTFALSVRDRGTRLAGLSFDAAVWELWPYLAAGASVAIADEETRLSPELLRDWLAAEAVTCSFVPTPLAEGLLALEQPAGLPLRALFTGGDTLHRFPPTDLGWTLVNNYGPSETTVVATSGVTPPAASSELRAPALGRPLDNAHVRLIGRDLDLVPLGVPGEICIGGAGVGRGYLHRPDETAERFIPDPWSDEPGARLYRSGDLGRYLTDGELGFLGRLDDQVKVRGFRIELGEVEAVLASHPEVLETAVVARPGAGSELGLLAFVVPRVEAELKEGELRRFLREQLPDYMVPGRFTFCASLPLTTNGKVNRKALPVLDERWVTTEGDRVAPRDSIELQLVQIWEELLDRRPIGIRDDFFALGGHSLAAVRLQARIVRRFGLRLPLATLFRGATVERLAEALGRDAATSAGAPLVEIQPAGSRPPLFCIHPVGGEVLCYAELAHHLGREQPVYGLQWAPPPDGASRSLAEMAGGYLDAIAAIEPRGPYRLAGWSTGGVVAFEMACQLVEHGEAVDRLVLIDSMPPGSNRGTREPTAAEVATLFARDLAGRSARAVETAWAAAEKLPESNPLPALFDALTAADLLPPELGFGELRRRFEIFRDNLRALASYAPSAYRGGMLLVRASETVAAGGAGLLHAWSDLVAGGVTVEEVAGDHWSLLRKPQVQALAERLQPWLEGTAG